MSVKGSQWKFMCCTIRADTGSSMTVTQEERKSMDPMRIELRALNHAVWLSFWEFVLLPCIDGGAVFATGSVLGPE